MRYVPPTISGSVAFFGTDKESIREAIKNLLTDPALCHRMGKNAREYAAEHFSLERVLELEIALLRKVIGK